MNQPPPPGFVDSMSGPSAPSYYPSAPAGYPGSPALYQAPAGAYPGAAGQYQPRPSGPYGGQPGAPYGVSQNRGLLSDYQANYQAPGATAYPQQRPGVYRPAPQQQYQYPIGQVSPYQAVPGTYTAQSTTVYQSQPQGGFGDQVAMAFAQGLGEGLTNNNYDHHHHHHNHGRYRGHGYNCHCRDCDPWCRYEGGRHRGSRDGCDTS